MTTNLLLRPDNGQPAAFLGSRDGMVALDTTCITPARRWYTLQVVQACNPTVNVMSLATKPPTVETEDDRRIHDNVLALTEVLNGRDPERQKSRDLYVYELTCDIADALAEITQIEIVRAVADGQLPERKAA